MNCLCLSAALLFLLVILVDGTPVYEHHSLDQGMSGLTFPLQVLMKLGESIDGLGGGDQWWGGCCQPSLDFSCQVGQGFVVSLVLAALVFLDV